MEGSPQSANRNEVPKNLEKGEIISRAKEIFSEMKQFDYQDVDSATHIRLKALNEELHTLMMDEKISWIDCGENKLPWDPRFEIMKQAANASAAA